ncbi:hypothetical protein GGR56DRAFT_646159 [Xylariaceae sp. FL0804]|nr:hypothetical protein GGR56DRAFT_646159 [Xylariaceae sp. FL0804]
MAAAAAAASASAAGLGLGGGAVLIRAAAAAAVLLLLLLHGPVARAQSCWPGSDDFAGLSTASNKGEGLRAMRLQRQRKIASGPTTCAGGACRESGLMADALDCEIPRFIFLINRRGG